VRFPMTGRRPAAMAPGEVKTFDPLDLDEESVLVAKGTTRISVVIPARDEELTIGAVLRALRPQGTDGSGLIDEVLVIDDGSKDATADEARRHGARVMSLEGGGKGAAMATGVAASAGDLIAFLDADVTNTGQHFVPRLVGPLLLDKQVQLVKAFYDRPFEGAASGGGRVTELCARPALSLLFPELEAVRQPLAGETAVRRTALGRLAIERGYRVEMGLLLDVAHVFGPQAIAQVDLGVRIHRNRPLSELGPMATEVLAVALERAQRWGRVVGEPR
jgi:glucosyl-3-phosphoglycerate synthase